jgi:hypothetical protein
MKTMLQLLWPLGVVVTLVGSWSLDVLWELLGLLVFGDGRIVARI